MRIRNIFGAIICMATIIGCGQEQPDNSSSGSNVKITASLGSELKWIQGDRMGIFYKDATQEFSNICYASLTAGAQSSFMSTEDVIKWEGSKADIMAYFPHDAKCEGTKVKISIPMEVEGKPESLAMLKKNAIMTASAKNVEPGKDVKLDFSPACPLIHVCLGSNSAVDGIVTITLDSGKGGMLAFGNGTLDIATGEIAAGGDSYSRISYKFSTAQSISSGKPLKFYLPIAPIAGAEVKVGATLSDGALINLGTASIPKTEPGKVTDLDIACEVSEVPGLDLGSNGTANTYIVTRAATTYKFDATVKGHGQPRTLSWKTEGKPVQMVWNADNLKMEPACAKLLWYSSPDGDESPVVVESVKIEDDYVFFDTPEKFVNGNALIAVYDAAGEILWSWDIWAVEGYNADETAVKVGRYTFMDRNIGAVAGKEARGGKEARAIGNYYQWGRKDPLPAASGFNDSGWGLPAHTPVAEIARSGKSEAAGKSYNDLVFVYGDDAGNSVNLSASLLGGMTPEQAMAEAVKNPHRWMASAKDSDNARPSQYKWFDDSKPLIENHREWKWMWGGVDYTSPVKSIYDPCPAGWMVPPADAFVTPVHYGDMQLDSKGAFNAAYGLYFPAAGERLAFEKGGNIANMGKVIVQTSTSSTAFPVVMTGENAICSRYRSPKGGYEYYYAGAGYQVRCVKESVDGITYRSGNAGPNAVLMGDSITEQWATPMGTNRGRVEFFTENNFVGKGISGHTSADMLSRYYRDLLALSPKVAVISAGINDIANVDGCARSNEEVFDNIRLMAMLSREHGCKVIIASCTPTWMDFPGFIPGRDQADRVIALNALLKNYANENGFPYADYWTALRDKDDNLAIEYCQSAADRVHPNTAGYLVMEKVLLDAYKKLK